MPGFHRKKLPARDTFGLFVDIKKKRNGTWEAKCKMAHCFWTETAGDEVLVSRKWVRHFDQVHVARWDGRT